MCGPAAARARSRSRSTHHAQVPVGRGAEVAHQVGPPVAGADHRHSESLVHHSSSTATSTSAPSVYDVRRPGAGTAVGVRAGLDERDSGATDPADLASRHPGDQRVVRDVADHHRAGRDGGPPADADRGDAHGARPDRGALVDRDSHRNPVIGSLEPAVGRHRAGVGVVGEHDGGTDEHAVPDHRRLVDERLVLDLAPLAETGARPDVDAAPQDRLRTDLGAGTNHGVVPHLGAGADTGAGLDDGGGRHQHVTLAPGDVLTSHQPSSTPKSSAGPSPRRSILWSHRPAGDKCDVGVPPRGAARATSSEPGAEPRDGSRVLSPVLVSTVEHVQRRPRATPATSRTPAVPAPRPPAPRRSRR